jgi:hypothetical protein
MWQWGLAPGVLLVCLFHVLLRALLLLLLLLLLLRLRPLFMLLLLVLLLAWCFCAGLLASCSTLLRSNICL